MTHVQKGAEFNQDRTHRYSLWRIWDEQLPMIAFVGLNPSNANENEDDPTIRRVIGFAQNWGYGGVYMLNLFTVISSAPSILKDANNWGDWKDCLSHILKHENKIEEYVFAWGNAKESQERGLKLSKVILDAICLEKNKNGSPKHPLYCKSELQPIKY